MHLKSAIVSDATRYLNRYDLRSTSASVQSTEIHSVYIDMLTNCFEMGQCPRISEQGDMGVVLL